MTLVLREPPFDGLRVVRELEPQDPEGNRGEKAQSENSKQLSAERQELLTADLRRWTQKEIPLRILPQRRRGELVGR